MIKIILKDQEFGRLTVLRENPKRTKSRAIRYDCLCSCGNFVTVRGVSLRNGVSSCGCIRIELLKKRNTIHGLSKHPLFKVWAGMKGRCYNPKNTRYSYYGGKGVSICKEWLSNFQPFYDWAISNGWKLKLTIDRKDNDGNYEPSNCHFITKTANNYNSSTSCFWIIDGLKFVSLTQAAIFFHVSTSTIRRWCQGYITTSNNHSFPHKDCYSIKKYPSNTQVGI